MKKLLFLFLVMIPSVAWSAQDIATAPVLGNATSSDAVLGVDASADPGNRLRRILFNADADYFFSGLGTWVDLQTYLDSYLTAPGPIGGTTPSSATVSGITVKSAEPLATFDDTDGANCYVKVVATDADRAQMFFQCDDSTGDAVTYFVIDGVSKIVDSQIQLYLRKDLILYESSPRIAFSVPGGSNGEIVGQSHNATDSSVFIKASDSVGTYRVYYQADGLNERNLFSKPIYAEGTIYSTDTIQGLKKIVNKSGSATLVATEMGGEVYVSAAATITLPAVTIGAHVCVYSTTANTVKVDANASDRIRLNGTALDDGDKIASAGAAGDFICLTGDSSDGWSTWERSGTWTDDGP